MSLLDGLNPEQSEGVLHTEGPLLILAGAGSGKTRVLTHRIAYLIQEKQINPWNIMAITFTNKAAKEMRERVDKIVGFGSESVWVSTFHSSCVRILRRYIDRIGYNNNFSIYDTDDQKTLMKGICKKLNIDTKLFKEKMFLGAISHAKDELISPEQFREMAGNDLKQRKIAEVYTEYQNQLKNNNALDFDDLIVKTVELFQMHPDVLMNYQERFRYIMVDEYQDTNTAQFKFISLLASAYENLCVVGDDDQSIYKFRGANIGNILNFEQDFPNAHVIKLEQNYRSTQNILNCANEVIKNNDGRKEKSLWTQNPTGDLVRFQQFQNGYEEAEFIAGDIRSGVRDGHFSYGDCAILYRTNAQSRLFEEKFMMANIPYKIVGGVNFYARKEIKDVLAYLKTIDNAQDDIAVRRIINVPKRGIGPSSIDRVQSYADENQISFYESAGLADQIPNLSRGAGKIALFVDFIERMRTLQETVSLSELFRTIMEETGYIHELELEETEESKARIENIDELYSKVVSYQEEHVHPTLSGFLEEVALIADIDTVGDDENRVLLMTLHSAKGLEFPQVYMSGMEDGLFPSFMSITADTPEELEEERRLCYVGITRAMKNLTLTCAQMRMVRGETQYCKTSRFVREIPRECIKLERTLPEKKTPEVNMGSSYQQMKEAFRAKAFSPKQFTVTKAASLDYQVGDTVKHVKFGVGIVTSITEGGRDYEVTVDFDRVGIKKMFASFAKLQKI